MTESRNVEFHPWGYAWTDRFPDATRVAGFEGGAVSAAEADGAWWLVTDEGTLADFLDDVADADILGQLIRIERFSDRPSWQAAIAAVQDNLKRGRDGFE